MNKTQLIIFAFILGLIPFCLSLIDWSYEHEASFFFFYTYNKKEKVIICPTLISTFVSISLMCGILIRNQKYIFNDYIRVSFIVLDILLFASIISIFVSQNTINFFGVSFSSQGLLIPCIILSWLGLKSIAKYVLLTMVALGIPAMSTANEGMGFYGAIFILAGFGSLIIQAFPLEIFGKNCYFADEFYGKSSKKRSKKEDLNNNHHYF